MLVMPGKAELSSISLGYAQLRRQTLYRAAVTWIDSNRIQVIRRLSTEEGPTAPGAGYGTWQGVEEEGRKLLRANRAAASWAPDNDRANPFTAPTRAQGNPPDPSAPMLPFAQVR